MPALQPIQCSCVSAGQAAPVRYLPKGGKPSLQGQRSWITGSGRLLRLVKNPRGLACCCALCGAPLSSLAQRLDKFRQGWRALRPYRWFCALAKLGPGASRFLNAQAVACQEDGKASSSFAQIFRTTLASWESAHEKLAVPAQHPPQAGRPMTAELLGTLAHELKHPLGPVSNGLSILRLKADDPAAVRQTVAMMERQVSQMSDLIHHMLDITRIHAGKLALRKERVALESVIASAIETTSPLIEAAQHVLRVHLPEPALMVELDPGQMGQVLVNLLNNAAKYTPDGGLIEVSACRQGQEVVITVADNGVGIPEASLAGVFDMFSQVAPSSSRAQGGLGIGLSLVRQLVLMHGGTVSASSEGPGRGSAFTVRLPQGSASGEALADGALLPGPAPAPEAAATGLRMLVVDDHEEAAQTLALLLELSGHTCAIAHDGCQALEKAREFRPEVVFLDIGMPGMDGYETARALRAMPGLERAMLVALTGWSDNESRCRSRNAGFDHHLAKPVDLATIEKLLPSIA